MSAPAIVAEDQGTRRQWGRWAAVAVVVVGIIAVVLATRARAVNPSSDCVLVNERPICSVLYRGVVYSLEKWRTSDVGVSAAHMAARDASVDTGYIWAFDSEAEMRRFMDAFEQVEANCWIAGPNCQGGRVR